MLSRAKYEHFYPSLTISFSFIVAFLLQLTERSLVTPCFSAFSASTLDPEEFSTKVNESFLFVRVENRFPF